MTGHPAIRNESSSTANRSPPTATSDTRSPQSEESVRRSLRALANGDASRTVDTNETASHSNEKVSSPGPDLTEATVTQTRRVIEDAESAVSSACDAVAFLAEGRLDDLDDAIANAARVGDTDVAARGRSARATLQRLDAALDGASATGEQACASTETNVDGGPAP